MNWIDYRKKLGIGFEDNEKADMLKNRIITFLEILDSEHQYSKKEYQSYCLKTYENCLSYDNACYCLAKSFSGALSIEEIVSKFVFFYLTYSNTYITGVEKKYTQKNILNFIKNSLNELKIPFEIITEENETLILPKGAEELDNALVSEPLQWLNAYPLAHNAFIQALKEYSDFNGNNASNIADYFRKALETFFQEFFGGGKALEHYIPDYGNYLKENSVPKEIGNNLQKILDLYTNFNNNYAKHHDKTTQKVLEYIMYETGNIIRLLITLKNN